MLPDYCFCDSLWVSRLKLTILIEFTAKLKHPNVRLKVELLCFSKLKGALDFCFPAQRWCGAHTWEEAVWTESRLHLRGWAAETVCPPQVPNHDGGEI